METYITLISAILLVFRCKGRLAGFQAANSMMLPLLVFLCGRKIYYVFTNVGTRRLDVYVENRKLGRDEAREAIRANVLPPMEMRPMRVEVPPVPRAEVEMPEERILAARPRRRAKDEARAGGDQPGEGEGDNELYARAHREGARGKEEACGEEEQKAAIIIF